MIRQGPGRARLLAAAKVAFAICILSFIAYAVDGREALRLLRSADPAWLAAAFAALTLQTLLSAIRWKLIAGRLDHGFGLGRAIREYYLSQVVNQTLPGGMLGDAGRAVRARGPAGLRMSGLAVALERISGQVAMVAVMTAGLVAAYLVPGGLTPPRWIAGAVLAVAGGVVGLVVAVRLAGWLPGSLGRGADILSAHVRRAVLAPGVLPAQIGLSLATAACNVLAFAACVRATGGVLSPGAITVLVPLVLFAMLVPVTVSGWGLREGAAAALLPLAGISGAQALAGSIAFGLVFLAVVLPGLWPLLAGRGARPEPQADPPDSAGAAPSRNRR